MRYLTTYIVLILTACQLDAAPFSITDISVEGGEIRLHWEPVPDRSILKHSSSVTGPFEYVGSVLNTNSTTVSNGGNQGFYRIRQVNVIWFPDTNFGEAVRVALIGHGLKYQPSQVVYDIDGLEALPLFYCDPFANISDAAGVEQLTGLKIFICADNDLSNLDLSVNTNLLHLWCYDNHLTKLDISACTALTYVNGVGCPITEIIVADTNNLPSSFFFSGNPVIREP